MEFITKDLIIVYFVGSIISILASMIYVAIIYRYSGKMMPNLISRLIVSGLFSWISAIITIALCTEIIARNINIKRYKYNSKYLDTSLLVKLRKEAQSVYEIHKLENGNFMIIGDNSTKYWNSEPMSSILDAKREYTRIVMRHMEILVSNLRSGYRTIKYSPWDKVTKIIK